MKLPQGLRDYLVVVQADLSDARRSRLALVLLVLYLIVSVSSTLVFIKVLHEIEKEVARTLAVGETATAGRMTSQLWEMEQFREVVTKLVGDEELARRILNLPPLALFYGWIAFTFVPALVILTASECIATEVGSGSARYALIRTSRLTWCVGKGTSQALMAMLAIVLGAVGAWITGQFGLVGFEPGRTALGMVGLGLRAWVYALPFLGLALGISQITRSQHVSRVMALLGLIGLSVVHGVAEFYSGPGLRRIWELVTQLTPQTHRLGLWYPDLAHQAPSAAFLVGLAGLYFVLGHLVFARRDA